MSFSTKALLSAVALFASAANAHISLAQPVPYGNPDTSPLDPSGSNYPCKTENGFKINSVTEITGSQSNTLSFKGSASHGGGSCQLSLTKGYSPTADSSFKVIKSFLGGCPTPADGNSGTVSFNYEVPKDVPDGEYTLAWTWFNKIGNREMYMNCAPIKVSGNSGSDSSFSALPDMAIYNIASKNTCGTLEGKDVQFPNPGKYVETAANFKPQAPTNCGGAAAAAPAPVVANSGSGNSGSATTTANSGQYTGVGAPVNKPASTGTPAVVAPKPVAGGSFAEGGAPASNQTTNPPAAAAPEPAAAAPAPVTGSSTSGGACGPDGSLICSDDGTQFGLCNWGKVRFQAVAAGTKCSGGKILKRQTFSA